MLVPEESEPVELSAGSSDSASDGPTLEQSTSPVADTALGNSNLSGEIRADARQVDEPGELAQELMSPKADQMAVEPLTSLHGPNGDAADVSVVSDDPANTTPVAPLAVMDVAPPPAAPSVGNAPPSRVDVGARSIVGLPGPSVEPRLPEASRDFKFRYRADSTAERFIHGALTVCAASIRGEDHRFRGVVRQDDFAVSLGSGALGIVAAVADGVSSAAASQVGATAAVNTAIEVVAGARSDVAIDWNEVARHSAWAVIVAAQSALGLPVPDPAVAEGACATTLAIARVVPGSDGLRAAGCGIGDSGVVLLRGGQFHYLVGGKPAASDIASNAVVALPRLPPTLPTFDIRLEVGDVLLLASDGILDPLGSGVGAVGDHLRRLCLDSGIGPYEFSAAIDFSRETFDDDRTLVAVWVT